jgi:hypothetical protein
MAVCAPNGTLCDLVENCIPSQAVPNHDRDILAFRGRVLVVEVEHDGVCLPTIDAWMVPKIGQCPLGRSAMTHRISGNCLADVIGLIPQVVVATILSTTRSAVRLQSTSGAGVVAQAFYITVALLG